MLTRLSLFLACLLAPLAAAAAQSVGPAADRIAAAERLLEAMNYDELQDRVMRTYIADAEKNLPNQLEAASEQPIPDELKARLSQTIANAVKRSFAANRAESRKAVVLIYAHHFTAEELDHLAQLQKDPVLVKMQAEMPKIVSESTAVINAQVQRDMPKLIEEVKQVVAEYAQGRT